MVREIQPAVQDVPEPGLLGQGNKAEGEYGGVEHPPPTCLGKLVQLGGVAEGFLVPNPNLDVPFCHFELVAVLCHGFSVPLVSMGFELQLQIMVGAQFRPEKVNKKVKHQSSFRC